MNRVIIILSLLSLMGTSVAQINEPPKNGMSKEGYMLMLLDSISVYQSESDTLNVIRCTAVLATNMHGSKARFQAKYYVDLAYELATQFSKKDMVADICNRYGMLYFAFSRHYFSNNNITLSKTLLDSSIYWHERAVAEGNTNTQGWGHRGLMSCYIRGEDQFGDDRHGLIDYHYHQIILTLESINDPQLFDHASLLYAKYLIGQNRLEEASSIIMAVDNYGTQPDQRNMYSYYHAIQSYIAKENGLDTLTALYWLMLDAFEQRTALAHSNTFHEMDQKFKVSQTKETLNVANTKLDITRRNLWLTLVVLFVFVCLVMYLILIYRKNKRLSNRNELLLKEQNHRVKNNLQMISSLLSLQSERLMSADAKEALSDSQSRVSSVALLHRMLYEGEQIGIVNMRQYLESLLEEITYSVHRQVDYDLKVPNQLNLPVEKSTSIGLIINELVTNSVKHTEGWENLHLIIHIGQEEGQLVLNYKDNGPGVSPEVWERSSSFGNQLVRIQSLQLKGIYNIDGMPGFKYQLRMPA